MLTTPKTIEYVQTPKGKLRGFKHEGIYHFLGIEYGHAKRWQTATPVEPWEGIKNAVQYGNRCFPDGPFTPLDCCGIPHEYIPESEDCLTLNVWSPSIEPGAKKPVIVWFHGGGLATGFANEMYAYEGDNQARFSDVVYVSVNHRLNIFGFLDVSKYGPQYANSGNCGLSDLVLSLKWVQENIAAFGGDPDNVMIHGQSGGGSKVVGLLQTKEADGLFHKAAVQSGGLGSRVDDPAAISKRCEVLVDIMLKNLGSTELSALEALTPEELMAHYNAAKPELEAAGYEARAWSMLPGDYYAGHPVSVGFSENAKKIPLMVGCTISEFPQMRILNKWENSREEQIAILREVYPEDDVDKLVELFEKALPGKCLTDAAEMNGRMISRPAAIRFADLRAATCEAPTYLYYFTYDFPQEGGRGAWHCAELPIIFHNAEKYPESFYTGLLDGLQDLMAGCWGAFAYNSDPNNKYMDVNWLPYKAGQCATMLFDKPCQVKLDFDRELSDYMETMKLQVLEKYTKFSQSVN